MGAQAQPPWRYCHRQIAADSSVLQAASFHVRKTQSSHAVTVRDTIEIDNDVISSSTPPAMAVSSPLIHALRWVCQVLRAHTMAAEAAVLLIWNADGFPRTDLAQPATIWQTFGCAG
jgi:hypothetical protein